MAFKITDDCTACGLCEEECPNNAISEGEEIFVIDPDLCTECVGFYDSQQCAEVCPMDACVPDSAHEETEEEMMEKKNRIHGA